VGGISGNFASAANFSSIGKNYRTKIRVAWKSFCFKNLRNNMAVSPSQISGDRAACRLSTLPNGRFHIAYAIRAEVDTLVAGELENETIRFSTLFDCAIGYWWFLYLLRVRRCLPPDHHP